MVRRKITIAGILKLLEDGEEYWFPMTRAGAYQRAFRPKIFELEDYFPSEIRRKAESLQRKGMVKIRKEDGGLKVIITERGRSENLKFRLEEFRPKTGQWDGKWRMVFFDIPDVNRKTRDKLRFYLKKLGMIKMQESVFVSPFDIECEVRYLREVLDIPHAVKMGVLEMLENSDELKKYFEIQ